jgi:hypothetical protein
MTEAKAAYHRQLTTATKTDDNNDGMVHGLGSIVWTQIE